MEFWQGGPRRECRGAAICHPSVGPRLVIVSRIKHRYAMENCITHSIKVVVLAVQNTRLLWVGLGKTGNINIQPVPDIYPPRIDDIISITSDPLPDPRINIEEIFPLHTAVIRSVVMSAHVVFFAHHGQRLSRHLDIEIPIPREKLHPC